MATILKRPGPNGKIVWQAQVRKRGYPSQIKTFQRKGDAERWARKEEHEMEAGLWKDTKEASGVTLCQALDRYLKYVTPQKRPSTQVSEKLSSLRLKEAMGKLSLLQVTPEKVAAYRDKRLEAVSANTVRIELALLSNLFTVAAREWSYHVLENPVQKIKKPQIGEGRCPMISEDQITKLVDECKKNRTRFLHPFVILALHTGCRSMELRGLRWSQVNLDAGSISLFGAATKGHRDRIIPLTLAAQAVLSDLKAKQLKESSLVFSSIKNPEKPIDMHRSFDQAVTKANLNDLPGLGKLRIHDLRHLCATYLIMNGVDLETVRGILGHRDLSTTQKYLHVLNEHKKKAITKIGNLGLDK